MKESENTVMFLSDTSLGMSNVETDLNSSPLKRLCYFLYYLPFFSLRPICQNAICLQTKANL